MKSGKHKVGYESGYIKPYHVGTTNDNEYGYQIKEVWLVDNKRVFIEATGKTFTEAFKKLSRPNGRLLLQDRERVSINDLSS